MPLERGARFSPDAALEDDIVETTSEAAVRTFVERVAQSTNALNPADLVQTRVDDKGRTVYRLSTAALSHIGSGSEGDIPASISAKSPHLPFARPSHQPRTPLRDVTNNQPTNRLQASRSIPLLRAGLAAFAAPATTAHVDADTKHAQRRLRRADSSPMLSDQVIPGSLVANAVTAPRARAAKKSSGNGQGDVLGRILGWRDGVAVSRTLRTANEGLSGAEGGGPGAGGKGARIATSRPSEASLAGTDSSDLPPDLVECLDAIEEAETRREHPFATPRSRPSFARGPFGSGVRIAKASKGRTMDAPALFAPDAPSRESGRRPLMREVSSNDSIRTARAEDGTPHAPLLLAQPTEKPRYRDPHVFDAFHRASAAATPFPTVDAFSSALSTPHGIPFGHHGRLDSTTSLASTRSDASHVSAHEITIAPAVDDDPRFVIWGIKGATMLSTTRKRTAADAPHRRASPASSATDSPNSRGQRRFSLQSNDPPSSPASSVRESVHSVHSTSPSDSSERVLMAATVERLVAELTSQISPELLAAFFLTYRNFLDPIDLLHLLLARFEWAMTPVHSPPSAGLTASISSSSSLSAAAAEDEALRRIVRVRTFVVFRYWLLNHFMQDFYPSREVRTTLTAWLNSSARDPRFRASPKDVRLVKALKKTVRKCKDAYILGKSREAIVAAGQSPVLGVGEEEHEDEVDLEVAAPVSDHSAGGARAFSNSVRAPSLDETGLFAPSILVRDEEPYRLPGDEDLRRKGPISRRLSNAMGTFGRIKRKLGTATAPSRKDSAPTSPDLRLVGTPTSALSHDLLRDDPRLSRYLEELGIELPGEVSGVSTPALSVTEAAVRVPPTEDEATTPRPDEPLPGTEVLRAPDISVSVPEPTVPTGLGISTSSIPSNFLRQAPEPPAPPAPAAVVEEVAIPPIYSFTLAPGTFGPLTTNARPASVRIELDDLDNSSDDDDDVIEAKRALKRLPPARTFAPEQPRRAAADESLRRDGLQDRHADRTRSLSALFVDDEEGFEEGELVTVIPNFVLDGLVDSDDEDEPGDVEAALRRLEGLVDDEKERKHALRVQQQMEKSLKLEEEARLRQQAAAGLSASAQQESSTTLSTLVDSPLEAVSTELLPSMQGSQPLDSSASPSPATDIANHTDSPTAEATVEVNVQQATPPTGAFSPPARKPNLTARLFGARSVVVAPPTLRVPTTSAPGHRAFVLYFRTDVLAQHFTLIERDLLRLLRYQELADGSWRHHIGETDVLDWEMYVKERRKAEFEAKESGQRAGSAVQDVVARFNLTANWISSEILLTARADERALVIAKFIRLAFKCYCQHNLQTMTQIVHGLANPDVERLRKTWARVPSWELRKLNGMKTFCGHLRNFKHLRRLMGTLLAQRDPAGLNPAASGTAEVQSPALGCIPFLGIFLRDLAHNADLPTFLDPSCPSSPADVTSNGTLLSLKNPEALTRLAAPAASHSSAAPLAPLVNVHKLRQLAQIVQRVTAFQELAGGYRYEPVPEVYTQCLKLRALDTRILTELSYRLEQ
ncbi:hypothetical protein JCM10908_007368 [Rhodotorula pacifica]|uniref:Ras-GEF domain-containing protein n=1 Tax=Rhodotorula pacifica TaxID=1495444 RepID=UPI0031761AEA